MAGLIEEIRESARFSCLKRSSFRACKYRGLAVYCVYVSVVSYVEGLHLGEEAMKRRIVGLVAVMVLVCVGHAKAAIVKYEISGQATQKQTCYLSPANAIGVGDAYTGWFAYDTEMVHFYTWPWPTVAFDYRQTPTLGELGLQIDVGGITYSSSDESQLLLTVVDGVDPYNWDKFYLRSQNVAETSEATEILWVEFVDTTQHVYSDTSIPDALDLGDFSISRVGLGFGNAFSKTQTVWFDVQEMNGAIIPEPSTLTIWSLLGLSGFGFHYYRKKRVNARLVGICPRK